jgi:hypothetical protein
MIELLSAEPSVLAYFEQRGSQLQFQWVVFVGDLKLKSDWFSLLEARNLDQHLLREFRARFATYEEIRNKVGTKETLAYFEIAKRAGSLDFEPPPQWAHLHHAYRVYTECKAAISDLLLDQHSSAEFFTLHPTQSGDERFFAYCVKCVWVSPKWFPPAAWLEIARTAQLGDDKETGSGRAISVQVRREVWRRDGGRCSECGSVARLEYDHLVSFSRGGSNTTRNIRLLCEPCNRRKASSI